MERNEALEKVRAACIRANPEIVELKFGCFVNKKKYGSPFIGGGYVCGVDRSDVYIRYGVPSVEEDTGMFSTWDFKEEEIIGRPIRLADVLLALYNADADYAVDTQGEFRKWGDTATNVFWNLRTDNLESQSDETLQAIANVLV